MTLNFRHDFVLSAIAVGLSFLEVGSVALGLDTYIVWMGVQQVFTELEGACLTI